MESNKVYEKKYVRLKVIKFKFRVIQNDVTSESDILSLDTFPYSLGSDPHCKLIRHKWVPPCLFSVASCSKLRIFFIMYTPLSLPGQPMHRN